MESPWGSLAVADAHVHFFSHGFFSLLSKQKPGLSVEGMKETLQWKMPPEDPKALAADWVVELDRSSVHRAALIASLPGDETSVQAAVKEYPERFFGFFMANPNMPDCVSRVESALQGGLRVPCLFPAMHQYRLSDPRVNEVLETVAGASKPVVFIHCGVLNVGIRKKLGLPSPFDLRFSNPVDVQPLALRFPNVGFILPHFGSGYFHEALMVAAICPNVYFDTSSSNSWIQYEVGDVTLETVFRRALSVVGPNRLLFGTDSSYFPRGWNKAIFEDQARALSSIGVSEETARSILGGNLEALLG
jgi:hypothetical protein